MYLFIYLSIFYLYVLIDLCIYLFVCVYVFIVSYCLLVFFHVRSIPTSQFDKLFWACVCDV